MFQGPQAGNAPHVRPLRRNAEVLRLERLCGMGVQRSTRRMLCPYEVSSQEAGPSYHRAYVPRLSVA